MASRRLGALGIGDVTFALVAAGPMFFLLDFKKFFLFVPSGHGTQCFFGIPVLVLSHDLFGRRFILLLFLL